MGTEIARLLAVRRRWRLVLLVAMLVMAICLALEATRFRDVASPASSAVMMIGLVSTLLACAAWWRHFRAYVALKRLQRNSASS